MASKMLTDKYRGKKMVESIKVRVPYNASSSSSMRNPRDHCKHMLNCCSTQRMIQDQSNFMKSSSPARIMFYQDESWVDFRSQALETLRSAFVERKPVIEFQFDGSKYLFDFIEMLQVDLGSGIHRSIAWIDENGKCFFPKVFVNQESEIYTDNFVNPKITIEIQIDGDVEKRKREETEVNSVNRHGDKEVTTRQRVIATELESSRWPNAKPLREGDRAYALVSNFFLSAIRKVDSGATITAIHQYTREGPLERARFEVFQKQNEITNAVRGISNTVYAWYGTSVKDVGEVLTHGFSEPSKVHGSDSYGVGVYLSPVNLPHLSDLVSEADDNGEKHVILCRVILGNVENVEVGSQQSHPSSVDFDTGVDDPRNPKWHVVWCSNMNRHILPEFVVSYRPTSTTPGQFKGSTCTRKWSLLKLLSNMKDSLPPSKNQEVATLFKAFKAGKLPKDVMTKRLRSIAGDEILLSTIREIRDSE